jgi:hypothetical protein
MSHDIGRREFAVSLLAPILAPPLASALGSARATYAPPAIQPPNADFLSRAPDQEIAGVPGLR